MIEKIESEIMKNWDKTLAVPTVSICTITYNHEKYIEEALDSFLLQETDFPFEIVIDDDCSLDSTQEIIKIYCEKYPNIMNVNLRQDNVGSMSNFVENMKRINGKYTALCEGDDYWIDNFKLQRQVEFLEKNKKYSGSGHQSKIVKGNELLNDSEYRIGIPLIVEQKDCLGDCPFQTASWVFKSEITLKYLEKLDITSGDKALAILISGFGPIKYFEEAMSIYRQHSEGLSSNITREMMIKDLNMLPWITNIHSDFPQYKYSSYIHSTIMLFPKKLKLLSFLKHYILSVFYSFSYFPINFLYIARLTKQMLSKLIKTTLRIDK